MIEELYNQRHLSHGMSGAGQTGIVGSDCHLDMVQQSFRQLLPAQMIFGDSLHGPIHRHIVVCRGNYEIGHLDLIILDLNMPVLAGADVLKIIQPEIKKYNLPVIILTGTTRDSEEIQSLRKLGAVGYLKKSDPPEYFVEKVKSLLHSTGA